MLEIASAEGVYIYTRDGKRYTDLISGISVSATGHRHPDVLRAIHEQLDHYLHVMVYGEFVQGPQVELARKLCSLLPPSLDSVYFVSTGAEATEGALKLAKRATGRTQIVGFENAYHGSTHGALSVIGDEYFRRNYRPLLPGVSHLRFNEPEDLQYITTETACVIAETIQGEAGIVVPDPNWLKLLRRRCDETGALLILDEIQTGMGRCGSFMAFEQFGVLPDILLLAKGLGGGLPLGAFISSNQLMKNLSHDPVLGHITTYGGNALCCAAGLAVTHLIASEQLDKRALVLEQFIRTKLKHPAILEIRGRGLLLAAVFENQQIAAAVMEKCMQNGLITDWFLFAPHCLRIAPPLTITDRELTEALEIFLSACQH
ncbi:MAG: aspartate aminotransferase family protein [Bacteroidia bacterium]|nr:aspartate aminotransferase family protein [Bacteroidia bacterium]